MNSRYRRVAMALGAAALSAALTLKYAVPLLPRASAAPGVEGPAVGADDGSLAALPLAAPYVEEQDPWTGVVLTETVEVSARFEGKLAKVAVRAGDTVRAGDVLAELDTKVQEQEIGAAQASLRAARADAWGASSALSHARERMSRRGGAVTVGSTVLSIVSDEEQSGARFESASAASRASSAQAAVQERAVRLEQLKLALADSVLRAPFDGVVAARYLDPGTRVQPSQAILRVVGKGAPRVRFAVPEEEVPKLSLDATVAVSWDGHSFEARVDRIAPEIESTSGTLFCEATLVAYEPSEKNGTALAGRLVAVRLRATKPG